LNRIPAATSPTAEMKYVAAIIGRLPIVSKKRPSSRAPRKLAIANGTCREREHCGVVDERLRGHQRESEHGAARVAAEHRAGDLAEAGALARAQLDLVGGLGQLVPIGHLLHVLLDPGDDPLRLLVPPVHSQPAGALRHVAAHQQDAERHHGTQREREPPAEVGVQKVGVQQDRGDGRRTRRRASSSR
jgi:hypothetical protein